MKREPRPEELLVLSAANLAVSSPEPYRAFVRALEVFANHKMRDVVNADSGNVLVAQGRAQAMFKLIDDLREPASAADRLRKILGGN